MNYPAIIKHVGTDWIGWIEEIPGVNCQEETREALEESLKITLQEALAFNREDTLALAGSGYQDSRSVYEADGFSEASTDSWMLACPGRGSPQLMDGYPAINYIRR